MMINYDLRILMIQLFKYLFSSRLLETENNCMIHQLSIKQVILIKIKNTIKLIILNYGLLKGLKR